MEISFLPPEILLNVLTYLPPRDIVELGQTSHALRAVYNEDFVWRMMAWRDYGVRVSGGEPREIYQKFYYRFCRLLGVYRLFTFFDRRLLRISIDPSNPSQIMFRTWLFSEQEGKIGVNVLSIGFTASCRTIARCLEEHELICDDAKRVFCFSDHSSGTSHHFNFHSCGDSLFYNPLRGDLGISEGTCPQERWQGLYGSDTSTTVSPITGSHYRSCLAPGEGSDLRVIMCSKGACSTPEFTRVVCCQRLTQLDPSPLGCRPPFMKPGVFTRFTCNGNTTLSGLYFSLFPSNDNAISLTHVSSGHVICTVSLLMSCDLNHMRRSVLTREAAVCEVDCMPGRPFSWCEAGICDSRGNFIRNWPKFYRAAYFDADNAAFLVFFDGNTVGAFFGDGTCDLFQRFEFT